jgi:hypothetical protein
MNCEGPHRRCFGGNCRSHRRGRHAWRGGILWGRPSLAKSERYLPHELLNYGSWRIRVSSRLRFKAVSCTINGLTCPISVDYLSFKAAVHVVPIATQQPKFLNLAKGSPYMFGNVENLTDRTQQIDNQPGVLSDRTIHSQLTKYLE